MSLRAEREGEDALRRSRQPAMLLQPRDALRQVLNFDGVQSPVYSVDLRRKVAIYTFALCFMYIHTCGYCTNFCKNTCFQAAQVFQDDAEGNLFVCHGSSNR